MEFMSSYKPSSSASRFNQRRMRDLNPRDFHLRVFETRALGRYANPPGVFYVPRMSELAISVCGRGSR